MAPNNDTDLNNTAGSGSIDPEPSGTTGGSIDPEQEPHEEETQDDESQDTATAAPEPNIIFVGDGEPLTKINDGMKSYKLPKVDDQVTVTGEGDDAQTSGKPFFHKDAGAIIQLFPDQYKRFVKKG